MNIDLKRSNGINYMDKCIKRCDLCIIRLIFTKYWANTIILIYENMKALFNTESMR